LKNISADLLKQVKENKEEIKKILILIISLIAIDQITKAVMQNLLENKKQIELIPGLLSLSFIRNEIAHLYQYAFYFILTVTVFPAIIYQSFRQGYQRLVITGLILLWSAIISNNLIDVFMLGYIRDFINLNGVAVGNVADQYRTAGVLFIAAGLIAGKNQKLSFRLKATMVLLILTLLALMILFWKYLSKYMAV